MQSGSIQGGLNNKFKIYILLSNIVLQGLNTERKISQQENIYSAINLSD